MSKEIDLDSYLRLAPGQHLIGVQKPEYQSISSWGMFKLPNKVEVFKFEDHGKNIKGQYVSSFTNERGCFMSFCESDNIKERIEVDKKLLAEIVGFPLEELIIREDAV